MENRDRLPGHTGGGNMSLQAVKLPMSHNNVVEENTVLQLNSLETGVLTLVVQNSSPTSSSSVLRFQPVSADYPQVTELLSYLEFMFYVVIPRTVNCVQVFPTEIK